MAKKSAIERNLKRDRMVKKFEAQRKRLKEIANNADLPMDERFQARLKLAKLPRNSAKVRVQNRCAVTGRPRGVYRKFKMSRIALRELASNGQVPGMVKSSW
ncbi:MAG: 30S ribosomal protein S14 [Alphaproteobacteria bacterium MarineAlpha11_Bin1]|nr:MAG: 30S ribosomal protein S14 [Alphaproteobacteria bacterium MarineAlpha11_Bin1]|tara:strand:- start:12785 stop:13090 length:306 start_codon:yes stop_codon:yes gene_type:complete